MVPRGKQRGHKRDLIEAGLNEAAAECSDAMGIVPVARWRSMFGLAWRSCTDGDLRANDVGGRALHAAVALVYDLETGGMPAQQHDRHRGLRGAVAGSTASSIEADLDYGWRRRDDHDVSQRNG